MGNVDFYIENTRLLAKGQFAKVERRLLGNDEAAKNGQDLERLVLAISALAHLYALPFKKDLAKAEHYFEEMFRTRPDTDSALQLVLFYYYSLADPTRTLEGVARLRSLSPDGRAHDFGALYTAVALEGLAHLDLGRNQDAVRNLEELLDLAARPSSYVVFGDEFNFLKLAMERNIPVDACRRLLAIS